MSEAILALGSNLGDRSANLRAALALLAERGVKTTRVSSIWDTPPMPPNQPRYLNAVAAAETQLSPEDLLETAKEVEHLLGRRPSGHWRPRPIDVDILFYGNREIVTESLTVPHPRLSERTFVLLPLAEVIGGPLPLISQTARDLLAGIDTRGHERSDVGLSPAR